MIFYLNTNVIKTYKDIKNLIKTEKIDLVLTRITCQLNKIHFFINAIKMNSFLFH